mmetsp:Transcript_5176/g.7659  ORF Transcript_5176/g.7659 Transcript_5176/m.7659 type:complete len:231 (+) Transcript_5176:746-1438(+)
MTVVNHVNPATFVVNIPKDLALSTNIANSAYSTRMNSKRNTDVLQDHVLKNVHLISNDAMVERKIVSISATTNICHAKKNANVLIPVINMIIKTNVSNTAKKVKLATRKKWISLENAWLIKNVKTKYSQKVLNVTKNVKMLKRITKNNAVRNVNTYQNPTKRNVIDSVNQRLKNVYANLIVAKNTNLVSKHVIHHLKDVIVTIAKNVVQKRKNVVLMNAVSMNALIYLVS